jgi:NAD(P)H-dependent FMN reductase
MSRFDAFGMSTAKLDLVVIIGSTRQGRFGPVVANWFAEHARRHDDMTIDVLDLADDTPPAGPTATRGPEAPTVGARLAAADAFVVVTPEYNHSFPAPLKALIDSYRDEWQAKPVGFVSYGGLSGGLRAVEHLRLVFAELHAVSVRDTVSFHNAHGQFDDAGRPRDPDGCDPAAKVLLDQLAWWGFALREARAARPYRA